MNCDEDYRRRVMARRRFERRCCAWRDALVIAAGIGAAVVLCWIAATRERRERAAWNEGYYGIDRATALAMADDGIGRTSEDVLREGGAR